MTARIIKESHNTWQRIPHSSRLLTNNASREQAEVAVAVPSELGHTLNTFVSHPSILIATAIIASMITIRVSVGLAPSPSDVAGRQSAWAF